MLNHALRYAPVVSALESAPGRTVLEVGSGSRGIAAFTSEFQVTACDVSFDDYGGGDLGAELGVTRVTGSVLSLPFSDASFDVVLALDLLEHIAPSDRPTALAELRRVAGNRLIIGCPCGEAAKRADERLATYYAHRGRSIPGWLVEHLDHGLPKATELLAAALSGDEVIVAPNANVISHERVLRWEATPILGRIALAGGDALRAMIRRPGISRWMAVCLLNLIGGRNREPSYRQIAVIVPPGLL
jgi:SAM-dependent methyltransferase